MSAENISKPEKLRLAVFDDCEIFRAGLFCVLSDAPDLEITVCSGFDAGETCVTPEGTDVILFHSAGRDVKYQAETLDKVKKSVPLAKTLLISEFSDVDYLVKMLILGCDGYVLKDVSKKALIRAIMNVSTEIFVFDRNLVARFLQSRKNDDYVVDAGKLAPREIKIIEMIARGMTNAAIASELGLALGTLKNIISALLLRFGFQKRSQLVLLLNDPG
jgi:DNA-binding NarL/FixJ family response regulator